MIDDATIERYMSGHCDQLATCLTDQLPGSQIVELGDGCHWLVRLADGNYLDILGVHAPDDLVAMGWEAWEISDTDHTASYDNTECEIAAELIATYL